MLEILKSLKKLQNKDGLGKYRREVECKLCLFSLVHGLENSKDSKPLLDFRLIKDARLNVNVGMTGSFFCAETKD